MKKVKREIEFDEHLRNGMNEKLTKMAEKNKELKLACTVYKPDGSKI